MATITSAASGNWSSTATWVGGVVPTAADDVIIGNNHNVIADVDFSVLTLSPTNFAGSLLTINSNRTITCTNINGIIGKANNLSAPFVVINTAGITVNINSNIRATFSGLGNTTVDVTANCVVNIIGNVINTTITTSNTNRALRIASNALVNITGNVTSEANSTTARCSAIESNSACTLNITGNVIGSGNNGNNNAITNETSPCTINIIGNVLSINAAAITSTQNSVINITGVITSTNNAVAVSSTNLLSVVTVSTPCFNAPNGIMAVFATNIKLLNSGSSQWQFATDIVATNKTLYPAGTALGNPAITDVRDGVTYASGALTGTLEVPPASSVAVGVPVDNTVGTAIISITDMGALLASYNV
jgi:hypothetical protein